MPFLPSNHYSGTLAEWLTRWPASCSSEQKLASSFGSVCSNHTGVAQYQFFFAILDDPNTHRLVLLFILHFLTNVYAHTVVLRFFLLREIVVMTVLYMHCSLFALTDGYWLETVLIYSILLTW
jgi:hypothetical protein